MSLRHLVFVFQEINTTMGSPRVVVTKKKKEKKDNKYNKKE